MRTIEDYLREKSKPKSVAKLIEVLKASSLEKACIVCGCSCKNTELTVFCDCTKLAKLNSQQTWITPALAHLKCTNNPKNQSVSEWSYLSYGDWCYRCQKRVCCIYFFNNY